MQVRVSVVGKSGVAWADEAVADWTKRMQRWVRLDEHTLRQEPHRGDVDATRAAESGRLLDSVTARDRLVVLDERGRDVDTAAFTELLRAARVGGVHRLVFALGGPYGHAPVARERAAEVIRLSSLVLNHEVARVVLYEQLYRALSILHGVPYHH